LAFESGVVVASLDFVLPDLVVVVFFEHVNACPNAFRWLERPAFKGMDRFEFGIIDTFSARARDRIPETLIVMGSK
jgi:hypothetical protein